MAEPGKQQMGDGQDNYSQAAKQARNAAKNIGKNAGKEVGKNAAKQAAAKGAEATVNSAAATVKAGVETGKAVSEIAAGTAAGGPWGAIISAAWAMRHTLFKILVCVCIFAVILITCIVSLPDIIYQNITDMFEEWFSGEEEVVEVNTLNASYEDLAVAIESTMQSAYEKARKKAEDIISDSKYDSELSKANFEDTIEESYNYDVAYILAAYSVSMEQNGTSKTNLLSKLDGAADKLFTVVATEKAAEVTRKIGNEKKTYTVTYVVCTIEFYDQDKILEIFNIDKDAQYKNYGITCGEYVEFMAEALKNTVSGVPEQN